MGLFLQDKDGNYYLFIAVDPFSKWLEIYATPSLYIWRAAKFLYNNMVAHWGKP